MLVIYSPSGEAGKRVEKYQGERDKLQERLEVGPGGLCSPRHEMASKSRHRGLGESLEPPYTRGSISLIQDTRV